MKFTLNRRSLAAAALCLLGATQGAQAAAVVFDQPPFAGSSADPNDNVRTVFGGGERLLPSFNLSADSFVFVPTAFNFGNSLNLFSGLAGALPPSAGLNVIVLQSTDNDNNPATAFNAGTAANLIADALQQDGAGFFVYHNSALGLNRLVYSSNLNSRTADLAILARIQSPTGLDAIAALPQFGSGNFAVPEPASSGLALAGLALMAALSRRRPA